MIPAEIQSKHIPYKAPDAEASNANKQLKIINKLAQDFINLSSREELVHYVTQEVVAQTGFVDCVIYLLDVERNTLVQTSAFGEKIDEHQNIVDAIEIPVGEGISGYVAENRKPVIVKNTQEDERYIFDVVAGQSEICVPIISDDELFGVIDCEHPETNQFNQEHLSFLTTIATMLAARLREWNLMVELEKKRDELSRALSAAETSNKAKTDFFAAISHDLRTPLNAIIGFSELITQEIFGELKNKKYAEYVKDINTSSQHLLNLVNDILDISTLEVNRVDIYCENFDVKEAIKSSLKLLYGLLESKNITLQVDIPDDLPPIYADRHALKKIIINLISNSIKFTRPDGSISISASVSDRAHILKFQDNGIGISETLIGTITEPFTREVADPYCAGQEGTGLGLTIVKALTELHGGELKIYSKQNEGTIVYISLPRPLI